MAASLVFKDSTKSNEELHIIAHEIRNPLVSVRGYASLLQDRFGQELPAEGREYLARIETNLKRLDVLLTDITRLAKISIDEENFTLARTTELVEAALESHVIGLHQNNLELIVDPDLPELYCDANSMVVVFSNLIGNAIKYSREKKKGKIQIGYLDDEIFHKFFVKDEGVGFRASDRNKVFMLFSRLMNKRNVGGTGLGLTIVKQIIEGHGGEIWVESRQNHGATFYFTLPKNTPGLATALEHESE